MADRASDADLRAIHRETIDPLYAFASRRCGRCRELAENVVQEAWLRAVRAWGRTGVYGLRLDANHFITRPAFNPALMDSLGLRNDVVPNRVYLSPLFGMQWYYGSPPQVAYIPGAARPPRAVIHLGAGVFQNVATSQLISSSFSSTGLPSSSQAMTCVGSVVPVPDWNAYARYVVDSPSLCQRFDGFSLLVVRDQRYPVLASIRAAAFSPRRGGLVWPGARQPFRARCSGDFVLWAQSSRRRRCQSQCTPRFSPSSEGSRPIFVDRARSSHQAVPWRPRRRMFQTPFSS